MSPASASPSKHTKTSTDPTHHTTTTTTHTVPVMSQYHAEPVSTAEDAGFEASAPELAPFLPTKDQSGGCNMPVQAGTVTPFGNQAALPSNVESVSLHAKAGFTG